MREGIARRNQFWLADQNIGYRIMNFLSRHLGKKSAIPANSH